MSSVFLIVWVLFIVVGVISNIRKSIKRASNSSPTPANTQSLHAARAAAARLQQQRAQQAEAALRLAQSQVHSRTIASVETAASQPSPKQPEIAASQSGIAARKLEQTMASHPERSVRQDMQLRDSDNLGFVGVFSSNGGILQAIIAQQVLGPPLALREQSIWNQQ